MRERRGRRSILQRRRRRINRARYRRRALRRVAGQWVLDRRQSPSIARKDVLADLVAELLAYGTKPREQFDRKFDLGRA